jgi:uncharacterized protein involved in exopolysaccharide biosynthesis
MSELTVSSSNVNRYLRGIAWCVRADLVVILLAAILIAAGGALVGKMTNRVKSTSLLVLSPMPLSGKSKVRVVEGKTREDELEAMLARPLDVKSTSLLCGSDEVLQKTLDQVSESGLLSKPIRNLTALRNALTFQVAVEKETPYDITYTPLIELTAEAKSPSDAKVIVNTWAKLVAEAAKKFQDAVQNPPATALEARVGEVHDEITQAELESEKFWTENNTFYLEARLNAISAQITDFEKERHTLQAEVVFDQTNAETLQSVLESTPPKVQLEWRPSEALAAALGPKLGLTGPKPEGAQGDSPGALTVEWINQAYWDISRNLAWYRAEAEANKKKIDECKTLIEALEKQRLEYQALFAKATTGKIRVVRELARLEDNFKDLATKREFARVAGNLNLPALQVISEGAEWPLPRFRRAILFGAVAGLLGFLAGACASVAYRTVLKPTLKG